MAKTIIEKIANIEEQIAQYENQKKQLLQQHKEQERKDRTKRLCKRAGLLESLLPDTIPLSDEQFKTFMEKTMLTDFTRRILDGLTAQNAAAAVAPQTAEMAAQGNTTSIAKPAETAQESRTSENADEDNSTRVSG